MTFALTDYDSVPTFKATAIGFPVAKPLRLAVYPAYSDRWRASGKELRPDLSGYLLQSLKEACQLPCSRSEWMIFWPEKQKRSSNEGHSKMKMPSSRYP